MRAILKAHGDLDRTVWAADSFAWLPPDASYKMVDEIHQQGYLEVSLEQVRHNFDRYGLLDDQVRFLPGWFCDTLPVAPIHKLAVLRLDGDLYESTRDALDALYPKVSVGGFVIVDDFLTIPGCKRAVQEYCLSHGIEETIYSVDWTAVYWRKTQ
jgi:O-methyltransferase